MKKEILKQIIRDFHIEAQSDLFERDINIPLTSKKIISLVGVRRSGKTYLLLNLIQKLIKNGLDKHKILYLNFEDERIDLKINELDFIIQAYRELYPDLNLKECYLFFDEIQNIETWEKFIRRIYDSITKNIFITGSNSKFLSSDIATSLRGRTVSYEVFPLSFNEYLNFNKIKIDLYSSTSIATINNYLIKYLNNGGFPEVINYDDNLREKILQEYFNVMIYRDLVERYKIKHTAILKFFIKRIFACSTKQLSVNTIYNEIKSSGFKIGKNQLYEYFEACQNIYLSFILKKYNHKIINRERGERKVYSVDNGLLNAINFKFSADLGKAMEQVVFLELKRRGKEIYFYKKNYECDFIVKEGNTVDKIIQVSSYLSDEKTKKREIRGIVEACDELKLKESTIITNEVAEDIEVEKIKIQIMPLYKWLLSP